MELNWYAPCNNIRRQRRWSCGALALEKAITMSKPRQIPAPFRSRNTTELESANWTRSTPRTVEVVYDASAGDTTGLGELMASLGRHKFKIALCALAGVAMGLAVGALTHPTYRAKTSLQLEDFSDVALLRSQYAAFD